MYSSVLKVTPELAQKFLEKNSDKNRNVRDAKVLMYSEIMKRGNWQLTPQGISFDENGILVDGQHRLAAIVKAGIPVEMYVTYDVPTDIAVFDRGYARTTQQILEFSGIKVQSNEIGAFNFMAKYAGVISRIGDDLCEYFFRNYGDSMREAYECSRIGSNHPMARTSPIVAAVWSAYIWGVDKHVLSRFCEVVNSGFYEGDKETSGIVLRKIIEGIRKESTHTKNPILFTSAQEAILCFAKGTPRRVAWSNPKAVFFDDSMAKNIILECVKPVNNNSHYKMA